MKVRDVLVGCIIETDNPFVIEQFKKHKTRYPEIKEKGNSNTNDVKTSKLETTSLVFCNLFIFFEISSLISTNALYSRVTTFSSAPRI